jgi:hypothetical protein
MKSIIKLSLATVLFGSLLLTSCSKEDDPTATPSSSDPRDKFLGSWHVSENSKDFGPSTYNCTISDSSDASHILLAPLYGLNKKVYATPNGNNFTIPSQTIQGNSVSANNGTLASTNQINLTYYVRTTSTHYDTVSAVMTK